MPDQLGAAVAAGEQQVGDRVGGVPVVVVHLHDHVAGRGRRPRRAARRRRPRRPAAGRPGRRRRSGRASRTRPRSGSKPCGARTSSSRSTPRCRATWPSACSRRSGRRVAITTETAGWRGDPDAGQVAEPGAPGGRGVRRERGAAEHHAVLLAGLRVGQVDLGGDRGRDPARRGGRRRGWRPGPPTAVSRPSPARRSPGPPGGASPAGRSACTPRLARSPRTRASVGPRPQSSSERSTTGPSTSRSKPIGLSSRSSSGPSATMGSGSVTVERVGGHLVGRLLREDEAALAGVVGPDRLPAELGDDAVHGHRGVEPEDGEPAVVDGPGPDHASAPATPAAGSARVPSCPRRATPPAPRCARPSGRAARGARRGRGR